MDLLEILRYPQTNCSYEAEPVIFIKGGVSKPHAPVGMVTQTCWVSRALGCCQGNQFPMFAGVEGSEWRRKWQPTPVFLPEESRGQRSLVG